MANKTKCAHLTFNGLSIKFLNFFFKSTKFGYFRLKTKNFQMDQCCNLKKKIKAKSKLPIFFSINILVNKKNNTNYIQCLQII